MRPRVACTIIARNYTPQARVLKSSFSEFNECEFVTLIVDGVDEDRETEGLGTVFLPSDLGLDDSDLREMMAIYDVMEFSTALKPSLLMRLLRQYESAVYFDPDIQVFADLSDVFASAREHGIVLTPHVLEPMPRDSKLVSEYLVMLAGIYNLGFIGVGAGAYRFLVWWGERLRYDAISDPSKALFTDQRWIDWVPALFPHLISRDAGLNAAHWNLHERPVTRRDGLLFAGDAPLRFLHFSGYDTRTPWLLSKHPGDRPRVLLSEHPELRKLCDDYGERLVAHGIEQSRDVPYRYGTLSNGLSLDLAIRRLLRAICVGDVAAEPTPPDPFNDADDFVSWLLTPSMGDRSARLTPLEFATWLARTDLQAAFPDVLEVSGNAYRDWFAVDPETRMRRDTVRRLRPAVEPREQALQDGGVEEGWTVFTRVGDDADSREVAKRIVDAVLATGLAVEVLEDDDERRPAHAARHGNLLMVIGSGIIPPSDLDIVIERIPGRSILLALGSAEQLSTDPLLDQPVDEVWVVDSGTAAGLASRRSVGVVRYPSRESRPAPSLTRKDVGLPLDRHIALLDVEPLETLAHSGALLAIEAFALDAETTAVAQLVVPIGGMPVPDRERVRELADRHSWLTLMESTWGGESRARLLELADVLLSLHSGPGLRLGERDAVALGTRVIARRASLSSDLLPSDAVTFADDATKIAASIRSLVSAPPPEAGVSSPEQERLRLADVADEFRTFLCTAIGGTS